MKRLIGWIERGEKLPCWLICQENQWCVTIDREIPVPWGNSPHEVITYFIIDHPDFTWNLLAVLTADDWATIRSAKKTVIGGGLSFLQYYFTLHQVITRAVNATELKLNLGLEACHG